MLRDNFRPTIGDTDEQSGPEHHGLIPRQLTWSSIMEHLEASRRGISPNGTTGPSNVRRAGQALFHQHALTVLQAKFQVTGAFHVGLGARVAHANSRQGDGDRDRLLRARRLARK